MNNVYCFDNHHLLHQITCRIHASLDDTAVQQIIVQELCGALEGDIAGLILYGFHNQTVTLAAAHHRTQSRAGRSAVESPVGLVLHAGPEMKPGAQLARPWVIHDLATAPLLEAERLLLETTHMPSLLMVPLVYQDMRLGMVYVGQEGACRLWTNDELSLAQLVAEQGAIALHHASQYQAAQQKAQREQVMSCIAQRIRNSLDIDVTINTALTELLKLTQATTAVFAVPVDHSRTTFKITHCAEQRARDWVGSDALAIHQEKRHRIWQETTLDLSMELDLGQVGDRLRQSFMQDPILAIANTETAAIDDLCRTTFQQQHIGAWLSVAVWYRNRLLGYLVAICQTPYNWHPDELTATEVVANQLAIAISHRQLYAATQRQAERSRRQTERLTQTLQQLYATQTHLIQSEKMSSLGQMVAGIAHEINNPINFIHGNIPYLSRYIQDLLTLLELYQNHFPNQPHEIAEFSSYIELEFVKSDLRKILDSMQTGVSRVSTIVSTLRNFSRLDEADKKSVDVHEGLDSTVLLLKHRLKPHIRVHRQYGQLPLVELYPRQLNQVFMSILSNAIDAINDAREQAAESSSDRSCHITLTTRQTNNPLGESVVQIHVTDTGTGIAPEHHTKIFDPFFTTKPVGTGTGLGLAISYRIVVHQHRGRLWFESGVHGGTTFIIELPLRQEPDTPPTSCSVPTTASNAVKPPRNHIWQRQTANEFVS